MFLFVDGWFVVIGDLQWWYLVWIMEYLVNLKYLVGVPVNMFCALGFQFVWNLQNCSWDLFWLTSCQKDFGLDDLPDHVDLEWINLIKGFSHFLRFSLSVVCSSADLATKLSQPTWFLDVELVLFTLSASDESFPRYGSSGYHLYIILNFIKFFR